MKENLFSLKQILFLIISIFALNTSSAQINFIQNFETGTIAAMGWSTSGYSPSNTNACNVRSVRGLLNSTTTSNYLDSPIQTNASNGNNINVSFNYKVINQATPVTATPANFGSLQVQYSLNGGNTYITAYTINNSNHIPSTNCTNISFTIPGTSVPSGNSFRIRFLGTHANGSFYIHLDDVVVTQTTASPPNCNAALISPANGASNVSVTTSSLNWSAATGIPTGYKLRVGTTSGGSNIINNVDVGNVTTYPISLNYSTTYYVGITPYNANGDSTTGCTEYTFTTAAPVTTGTPWSQEFASTALPNGWLNNGFTIATSIRLPGSESNIIFKNLNNANPTGNFSTISVGEISSGDELSFTYRLGGINSPYNPPATGSGNFIVSVSTDYGMTYTNVQTIPNNAVAGWQNFSLDLSSYTGEYVRIKITTNRTSEDYYIGFDNFHIGQPITCIVPENLLLNFAEDDNAQISWNLISNASSYNWYIFSSGANPQTATPLFSGTVSTPSVNLTNLIPSTDYDFYVEANCGVTDGISDLSAVLPFTTQCETINSFPFTETFESNSSSLDCWTTEYVSGNTDWTLFNGAGGGSITSAHSGTSNALFFFAGYITRKTKLVSPSFDITDMTEPKLTFWYANEQGPNPEEQNELKIYYKTSASGTWTLIPGATYNSNVNVWTYVELDLPSGSENYYIAFEGTNHYGEGIVVDDVTISDFFICPETIWDGLAWSNGTPDIDKKAIINGSLILNSDLSACELEVSENGSLEIASGFSFTIKGLITNNAAAEDFIVANEGNLIQVNDIENIGEITVIRESQPMVRLDYTMWSSPVSNQNLFGFSPNTVNGVTNFPGSTGRIYVYNGSNGYVNPTPFTADAVMNEAVGYLFRSPNNWNAEIAAPYVGEFTGVANNGNVSVTTVANNFTSIGNPYPSNINADLLLSANPGISTLYYWNNTGLAGNNYASYTFLGGTAAGGGSAIPDEFISVGQGFIVATEDNSVEFTNAMRTNSDAIFFRTELAERHRYWLNLKDSNNTNFNTTLTGYMTGATNGHDNQIDGKLFGSTGSVLYSLIEGSNEKYVIQGRAVPFLTTDVVGMGVRIINAGQFTINLTQMDGLFAEGQQIYIHDKYLNITHNLTEQAYNFNSDAGEFNDRFEIVYENEFCPSSTTWDGFTWSNGLPDSEKKAIINGNLVLNNDLEACQLEVTQNGNLKIPSGFTFKVNDLIINNSTPENFIVASGGNLIQVNDIENIGEITVIRESQPMVRLDYTMWSSPVSNQNLFGFSPNTVNGITNFPGSTGRIYVYNGSNGYVNPTPFTAGAVMNEAVGYLFRSPNNWNAEIAAPYVGEFTGVANNGNVSVTTVANNFTSIGNPYPSNINADLLLSANSGISTLYYWNNTGSPGNNYATYTRLGGSAAGEGAEPNEFISVGQGFIVANTDTFVNFDNTMRISNPANFFKVDEVEKHRFWLNLNNENNVKYNQILVGYMTGATNEFDNQIDGKQFGYEGSALYSLINEENYSVQGRAIPFQNSDVVKLGFKAAEAGRFNISLANFDGLFTESEVKIYLKDNQTNTFHNLMESAYTFESEAGEFNTRFEIVYEEDEVMGTGDLTASSVQIYKHNQNIVVESKKEKILSIELFDLAGRNIFRNEKVNANYYEFNSLSKGALIVRVQTQNGEVVTKRVINK